MENKSSNIKERVLQIAEIKGVGKEKFFETIGMTYGNFKGKSKETPLNSNAIADIFTIYPDINLEWLLTGRGEILNDIHKPKVFKLRNDQLIKHQEIPLYDLEASAGLVQLFKDGNSVSPIDTISIPNLPKCDGALYVVGDSMYPLLKSGDIVMYKQVHDLPNDFFWGEMYLIHIDMDGDTYTTVKYIQKSEVSLEHIKLVSYNQHHSPKDIHLSRVRAVALVKASVRINSMT
ncbi:helix-turn-helix transcriptional regulator [Sphingobacterium cellulitidis]|uniref:S24 family peptidase n=1 Tax=Sphingobacterium cellulitidis TaxID=1768011 RepID=UPI00370D19CC